MSSRPRLYPYAISNQLLKGCRQILKACELKEGSKLLLLTSTNYREQHIVNSYYQAALDISAEPAIVMTEPYQIPGIFGKDAVKVPKMVEAAMQAADYIFFLGTNIFYTQVLERIQDEKKPAYFAYNSEMSTEWLITHYPPPYKPLVTRTDAGLELVSKCKEFRYTTPAGTDLVMGKRRRNARPDREVGFLEPSKGHTWDILGGAGIYAFFEPESCNGKYVITSGDYPSQIMDREYGLPYMGEDIVFTIKDGIITKIDGGAGAKLMRKWFEGWHSEGSYVLAHMGIGTDPRQKKDFEMNPIYGLFGWDGEWIEGFICLGVGYAPSHLDMMQRNGSVWFDDEKVLDNEKFVGPLSDEALGLKKRRKA